MAYFLPSAIQSFSPTEVGVESLEPNPITGIRKAALILGGGYGIGRRVLAFLTSRTFNADLRTLQGPPLSRLRYPISLPLFS